MTCRIDELEDFRVLDREDARLGRISLQPLVVSLLPSRQTSFLALRIQWDSRQGLSESRLEGFDLAFRLISTSPQLSSIKTPVFMSRLSLRPVGSRRTRCRLRLRIQIRTLISAHGFLPQADLETLSPPSPAITCLSVVNSISNPCVSSMTSGILCTSVPFQQVLWEQLGVSRLPLSCYCHESLELCEFCKIGLNKLIDLSKIGRAWDYEEGF